MRKITLIFALVITAITAMGQNPYPMNYPRINMGINSSSLVDIKGQLSLHNVLAGGSGDSVAVFQGGKFRKVPRSQFTPSAVNGYVQLTPSSKQSGSIDINGNVTAFGLTTTNSIQFDNNTSGGTAQSMLYKYAGGYDVFGYDATTRFLTWGRQLNLGALNITATPTTASNTTQVLTRNPTTGVVESVNSSTFVTATPTLQQVTTAGNTTTTGATFGGDLATRNQTKDNLIALRGDLDYPAIQGADYTGGAIKQLLLNPFGGDVAIGKTTAPTAKLDVNGAARISLNDGTPTGAFRNQDLTSKLGASNGIAPLDGSSKIPAIYLPAGAQVYKGTWNAATNTPTLADGSGTAGWTYRVEVGGVRNLGSGNITFVAGDDVIYNGSIWQRNPSSVLVSSVNGMTGAVVIDTWTKTEADARFYPLSDNPAGYITVSSLPDLSPYALKNGTNSSGNWPINITGTASIWGGRTAQFGSGIGTVTGILAVDNDGIAREANAAKTKTFLNISDGSTLVNSISGNAVTWAGLSYVDSGIASPNVFFTSNTPNVINYSSVNDVKTILGVPTQISQLTNNSGFITSSALAGYATESFVNAKVANDLTASTTVAPSKTAVNGALATKQNNLTLTTTGTGGTATLSGSTLNIPVIPTNNNQLTNGRGYLTSSDLPTITSGTYTPTTSSSGITLRPASYTRIGNVVTVYGSMIFNASSTGTATVDVSLPITTYFNDDWQLSGTGTTQEVNNTTATIEANTTSGIAMFYLRVGNTGSIDFRYTFQYTIQNL